MTSFDVRPIGLSELSALLALYAHLHRADSPLPEASVVAEVWREAMENPRCRYVGGYADGALVSSCSLMVIPNLTRSCRPFGVIENVVTHANHRHLGYAKAVLAYALTHAWSAGCYKVMLMTGRKDAAIVSFYEAAGFDGGDKLAFVARPPV